MQTMEFESLTDVARAAGCSDESVRRVLRGRRDLEPKMRAYPGGPRMFTPAEAAVIVEMIRSRRAG